jgi:cell division protein ZapD
MIIYEQPLTEKIRIFLRLEQLIKRFNFHIKDHPAQSSESAVGLLLELYNLAARLDLKSEILKEIDRQATVIKQRREQGKVDVDTQDDVLDSLSEANARLYDLQGPLGQRLKSHNFFTTVHHRSSLPGGVNGFDIPLYHYWLNKPTEERIKDLEYWVEPYQIANDAIQIIMVLIRGYSFGEEQVAKGGFYQSTLDLKIPYQLLRIELPDGVDYYPEVSAGRQRFSIRFVRIDRMAERGKQVMEDIDFKLTLCSF